MAAVRRVWIPTAGFVVLSIAVGLVDGGRWAAYSGVAAVLLTPIVWPAVLSPRNRTAIRGGAAAGAWVAFLAQMIPCLSGMVWFRTARAIAAHGEGLAGLMDFLGLFAFLLTGSVAALLGAALGAFLQRRLAGGNRVSSVSS